MHYTHLEAKNIGPFLDFETELTRGLIGIFGRNGCGKSSLLNLLYAIPYNDFSRFPCLKSELINDTAPPKSKSYVEAVLKHDSHELRFVRSISPPSNEFRLDGGKALTDDKKIKVEVEQILGMDNRMLDKFVFKRQDEIYDFISSTDTTRKKAFQVLCKTEECEAIWAMFGEFLNKDADLNTQIVDNSDELVAQMSELTEAIAQSDAEREKRAARILSAVRKTRYEKLVRRSERHAELLEELAEEAEALPALRNKLGKAQSNLEKREASTGKLERRVKATTSRAEQAKVALATWADYDKQNQRLAKLRNKAELLEMEREENPLPGKPRLPEDFDAIGRERELLDLNRELRAAKAILERFADEKVVVCPTCRTPVADLKEQIKAQRLVIKNHPGKIAALEELLEIHSAHEDAVRQHQVWKARFDAELVANEEALAAIKTVKTPTGARGELQAIVVDFDNLTKERDTSKATLEKRRHAVIKAQERLVSSNRRCSKLTEKRDATEVDEARLTSAKKKLAKHSAAELLVAEIDGRLKEAKSSVARLKEDLDRLKARLKQSRKLRKMGAIISQARDVVHRDNLPNRVARKNLLKMEGRINEGLGHFGNPYWVESDDDLTFTVHAPGHPPFPGVRLSTGQRVVLAIPFWLSAAWLWHDRIGMLALDEPTANLDPDNRSFLSGALEHLNAQVRGSQQLIIVTHDESLRSAFDQVIDLV